MIRIRDYFSKALKIGLWDSFLNLSRLEKGCWKW